MKTVNIHEAKIHLSRLIDQAVKGEPFIITKAGTPIVKVTAVQATDQATHQRLGFMRSQIEVPDDFDRIEAKQIEQMFGSAL